MSLVTSEIKLYRASLRRVKEKEVQASREYECNFLGSVISLLLFTEKGVDSLRPSSFRAMNSFVELPTPFRFKGQTVNRLATSFSLLSYPQRMAVTAAAVAENAGTRTTRLTM